MVTCVGPSAFPSHRIDPTVSGSGDVGALEGRIQQARAQLTDWSSCVSAKTPKGQAEIQKFSGEISADKQKIAHLQQSQSNSSAAPAADRHTPAPTEGNDRRGVLVDLWA
jgi:hypothetical protein